MTAPLPTLSHLDRIARENRLGRLMMALDFVAQGGDGGVRFITAENAAAVREDLANLLDHIRALEEGVREASALLDSYGPDEDLDDPPFIATRNRLRALLLKETENG